VIDAVNDVRRTAHLLDPREAQPQLFWRYRPGRRRRLVLFKRQNRVLLLIAPPRPPEERVILVLSGEGTPPTGRSSSTCQFWLKATMATAIKRSCTITTRIVSRPIRSSGRGGGLSPGLSRANQPGAATAAKIARMIASAEATGSTPRFHRATSRAKTTYRAAQSSVMIATLVPSRRVQPPIVITTNRPAETSRTSATIAFVVFVWAFSLFGRQTS
jgi:hypothetical protein